MTGTAESIAIIDVETTGTNPEKDRVVEFAVQKGLTGNDYKQVWRVNPGMRIPPAATAVHGISDDDVKDQPPFSALIPAVRKILNGADIIVGYNLDFDLKCIAWEFRRCGAEPIDLSEKILMDPLQIWRHFEPRKLEDAVKRFVGEEHTTAHSAEGDVAATGKVLLGMLKAFGLEEFSWRELQNVLEPERPSWVGPTSHLKWSGEQVVINFGKNLGKAPHDLLESGDNYLEWILNSDFPSHVKEVLRKSKELPRKEFLEWAMKAFPQQLSN